MHALGYFRVAVAAPAVRVADCRFNAEATLALLESAQAAGADLAVFPELGLTGYTCHDLFHTETLLSAADDALAWLLRRSPFAGVAVVGLPVRAGGRLFNAAAAVQGGRVLAVVPKTYLPNYKEFYDARYFAPAPARTTDSVRIAGQSAPFGVDILLEAAGDSEVVVGVEICEDLWAPVPPSSHQALAGAVVLANLSASNETIGKAAYRRQLVAAQSGRCLAAYLYAGAGPGESTTDVVFGGHCLVAENGSILTESKRFEREGHVHIADVDIERLHRERSLTTSFHGNGAEPVRPFRRVAFELAPAPESGQIRRAVEAHPFVPSDPATLRERCEDIFQTQTAALARRLEHAQFPPVAIGVSGGLDSTLALLVLCKTLDLLGRPRGDVRALTMPGFGTSPGTRSNAHALAEVLGVSLREVDIRGLCLAEMQALAHRPFGLDLAGQSVETLVAALTELAADNRHDLTFENVQARMRTSLLMNTGFVIGTGDLSELALGWCTYNADHMSMYNPNVSIPKTLVKLLVRWTAEHEFAGEAGGAARATLLSIVGTEISPELLPAGADGALQSTEATIGPYELHDFFLYHFLRFGAAPAKILALAGQAKFARDYTPAEVKRWLAVFFRRFFANQFKRSCLPDGPKVGSVSVSPRGDWRMPSDAAARAWLEAVEAAGA